MLTVNVKKVLLIVDPETTLFSAITLSGEKIITEGKATATERYDFHMLVDDMGNEPKILLEKLMGLVIRPEVNRLNQNVASEQ